MVYCDNVHLIADDVKELHEFAKVAGINKCWYHPRNKKGKFRPHYDVTDPIRLARVYLAGAKQVSGKEIVTIMLRVYGD